jgi:hypothetical protein
MKHLIVASTIVVATAGIAVSTTAQQNDPLAAKMRVLAQGMLTYAQNYDDTLPLAFTQDEIGMWRWNKMYRVPDTQNADAVIWANAVRQYWPMARPLAVDGPTNVYNPYFQDGDSIGITFNGLLHTMKLSSIEKPGLVPLMWTPHGKQNFYGSTANPTLVCFMHDRPCIFGGEFVGSAHFFFAKEIIGFDSRLYAVNLNQTIQKPKVYTTAKAWKEGIYSETPPNSRAIFMSEGENTNERYPLYFSPARKE